MKCPTAMTKSVVLVTGRLLSPHTHRRNNVICLFSFPENITYTVYAVLSKSNVRKGNPTVTSYPHSTCVHMYIHTLSECAA